MPRFQIEPNIDGDEQLPGGRQVVHRASIVLTLEDLAAIARNEAVKLSVAIPNWTVRHLFLDVKADGA